MFCLSRFLSNRRSCSVASTCFSWNLTNPGRGDLKGANLKVFWKAKNSVPLGPQNHRLLAFTDFSKFPIEKHGKIAMYFSVFPSHWHKIVAWCRLDPWFLCTELDAKAQRESGSPVTAGSPPQHVQEFCEIFFHFLTFQACSKVQTRWVRRGTKIHGSHRVAVALGTA